MAMHVIPFINQKSMEFHVYKLKIKLIHFQGFMFMAQNIKVETKGFNRVSVLHSDRVPTDPKRPENVEANAGTFGQEYEEIRISKQRKIMDSLEQMRIIQNIRTIFD